MAEDIGFEVQRKKVYSDRALIDAKRVVFDNTKTRLKIAYDTLSPVLANGHPDDPKTWKIF